MQAELPKLRGLRLPAAVPAARVRVWPLEPEMHPRHEDTGAGQQQPLPLPQAGVEAARGGVGVLLGLARPAPVAGAPALLPADPGPGGADPERGVGGRDGLLGRVSVISSVV